MSLSVTDVREIIDESLGLLKKRGDESDTHGLVYKLESVRSVLIRNEKKIWLRTKKGRGMVVDVREASERLRNSLASSSELDTVYTALSDVETLARAIEEESRKRSMVVT